VGSRSSVLLLLLLLAQIACSRSTRRIDQGLLPGISQVAHITHHGGVERLNCSPSSNSSSTHCLNSSSSTAAAVTTLLGSSKLARSAGICQSKACQPLCQLAL
jgi:hypothetical protein